VRNRSAISFAKFVKRPATSRDSVSEISALVIKGKLFGAGGYHPAAH